MPTGVTADLYGISIVALIVGVVQACKAAGLDSRFSPLLSLFLGLCGGFLTVFSQYNHDIARSVLIGLVYGLSASGLWSGGKATIDVIKEKLNPPPTQRINANTSPSTKPVQSSPGPHTPVT